MTPPLAVPVFRRPFPPEPVERFIIPHPRLPQALEGLRILHLSDLHVRRTQPLRYETHRLHAALAATPHDLLVLTGDSMNDPGHERAAFRALADLAACSAPRLGRFAVFGNHDSPDFRRRAPAEAPGFRWLGGRADDLEPAPGATLRLLGLDDPEDLLALRLRTPGLRGQTGPDAPHEPFTIALAHYPAALVPAAQLGLPLVLCGHTHAGQIRLSSRFAPHTSGDTPPHLAAGCLRLGDTLACISRGLGDGVIDRLRLNCPRQAPLYQLTRAPLPALLPPNDNPERNNQSRITQVIPW